MFVKNIKIFIKSVCVIIVGNLRILLPSRKNIKSKIENSLFWDADWYIENYHKNFNKEKALEYWCRFGWLKGELPSKYFDKNYINHCILQGEDPILHYTGNGKRWFPNSINPYKSDTDEKRIRDYWEFKNKREPKGVVYTCITDDYDDINEIKIHGYIDNNWDYICFTDNKGYINSKTVGVWDIRPLHYSNSDNTRNNRWHKFNPHVLFPNYRESIYIDSNINILTSKLFDTVENSEIKLPKHFKNTCIYQEYKDALKANLDSPSLIKSELNLIRNSKMPKYFGFTENNIIYRHHNKPNIIKIDMECWDMILNFSKRDQLAFAYILWKNCVNIKEIMFDNPRYDVNNYYVFAHKKGGKS